ncbi:MAG: hypothetical protein AB7P49_05615 [Bdellovibrionales bacterium]
MRHEHPKFRNVTAVWRRVACRGVVGFAAGCRQMLGFGGLRQLGTGAPPSVSRTPVSARVLFGLPEMLWALRDHPENEIVVPSQ